MLRIISASLLLIALIAALPAAAAPRAEDTAMPQATAPGTANPEFMGMVIRDPFYEFDTNPAFPGQPNQAFQDRMGQLLANAGVRWVRLDFLADPDGHVNFAKYDYFIGTVAPKYGFKVLGLLNVATIRTWVTVNNQGVYYPILLNTDPATLTHPKYGAALNQYMIDWLDEALRVAAHYDGSDAQAGRVHAFEIFNEMNRLFGDGTNLPAGLEYAGLNPDYVARIHAKFYRICKNTDGSQPAAACPSDTQIILGGLHPKGTSNRRTAKQKESFKFTDEQYLQQMYASAFTDFKHNPQNLAPWNDTYPLDGIGYHPYPEEIAPRASIQGIQQDIVIKILPRLQQLRDTLKTPDVNDPDRPFWITEIGYNVAFYKNGGAQAPQLQAEFMRQVYTALAARGDVANVFWFKYEDFPPASGTNAQMWGIVRIHFDTGSCPGGTCYTPSGEPELVRPAYLTYRELAGLPILRMYLPSVSR